MFCFFSHLLQFFFFISLYFIYVERIVLGWEVMLRRVGNEVNWLWCRSHCNILSFITYQIISDVFCNFLLAFLWWCKTNASCSLLKVGKKSFYKNIFQELYKCDKYWCKRKYDLEGNVIKCDQLWHWISKIQDVFGDFSIYCCNMVWYLHFGLY